MENGTGLADHPLPPPPHDTAQIDICIPFISEFISLNLRICVATNWKSSSPRCFYEYISHCSRFNFIYFIIIITKNVRDSDHFIVWEKTTKQVE